MNYPYFLDNEDSKANVQKLLAYIDEIRDIVWPNGKPEAASLIDRIRELAAK